ncbi:MAG: hypothetical protein AAFV47_10685 [Pseudomonadota bacterium]
MGLKIQKTALPTFSLLRAYETRGYTDCYCVIVDDGISLERYLRVFFGTRLFAIERRILMYAAGKPSTQANIDALAAGTSEQFAAWSVERREDRQILLCDFTDKTRSWLMCEPRGGATCLYFGSAVVASGSGQRGRVLLPWYIRLTFPFHRLYSRLLLGAAVRKLNDL